MKTTQNTENQQVKKQIKKHLRDNLHAVNKLQTVEVLLTALGLEDQRLKVVDSYHIYNKVVKAIEESLDYQTITNIKESGQYEYDEPICLKIKTLDRSRYLDYTLKVEEY